MEWETKSAVDEMKKNDILEKEKNLLNDNVEEIRKGLSLAIEADDVITYAIQQNGVDIIDDICIKNSTGADFDDLTLYIDSDTKLIDDFKIGIQKVRAGEELHLKNLKVNINGDYLASLTERITCSLRFRIFYAEKEVLNIKNNIVALAYDQWPGLKYTPEILAAFSTPNHPVIIKLLQVTAQYLNQWTGDPSLAGYQFDDSNRVKQMAAAAYAAIQQKNITYANPPSSFEVFGQRIRMADMVVEQGLGTCMDMTLLYVGCLEAMGLNPIMILTKGHIFAGVWLVEDSFPDTIVDDPSQLEKRMANGINELLVVECTAMCAGKVKDFDEAVKIAENTISQYDLFEFVIDVTRARSMGIRPLPVRIITNEGFVVRHEERKENDVTVAPREVGNTFDLSKIEDKQEATKQTQWERKLLDLSMRNMLINLRFTKAVVPLLCGNISLLEDALNDGEEFQVLPRPDNMEIKGNGIRVESLANLGPFQEYIELENKHKKLHSFYLEKELNGCLTKMYRSAKTSLEENGVSTLYLALGLLRWAEKKNDESMRYAPIILVPIDIIRKSASKGYTMRMRDEDAQINITLLEFLKKNYDIQIKGLNPLPTDEHGLDVPLIFAIIRKSIMSLPMWDVLEVGLIGNFSFSQFVMWNDIHNHEEILEKNNIVRSLIKGAIDWDCSMPKEVDTDEAYLPVNVDSSQLRAINMAANNVSFVLHGPPGTGKSQTITAMIANALTKGKTVLFVAEKMAALEVVQKRLEMLGIGDFCLELHSNKATKKSVLDQLKKNLEIDVYGLKTNYEQKIEDLRTMRSDIDSYVEKLHEKRRFGKSLKELIDIYETIPDYNKELKFSPQYIKKITQKDLDTHRRNLEQLVALGRALGHPYNHPLKNIRQTIYTQTLKMNFEDKILAYKNSLEILKNEVEEFAKKIETKIPADEKEWKEIYKFAESIISLEQIPNMFLNIENLDKEFDFPLMIMDEKNVLCKKKEKLMQNWKESFLKIDVNMYREKYEAANKKWIGKGRALNNLVTEIQAFGTLKIDVTQIPAILKEIELYQMDEIAYEEKRNKLSFEWKQIVEKYCSLSELNGYKEEIKSRLENAAVYMESIRKLHQSGKGKESEEKAKKLLEVYENVIEKENDVVELLKLKFDDDKGCWIDNRIALCNQLIINMSSIKEWIVYRQVDELCRNSGLEVVCDAYEEGLPHEQVMDVYFKSIYKAIILAIIEEEPVLNSFTGNGFNEKITQFKKLDEELLDLTKEEMYSILTHNLPSPYDSIENSKELNILRRAISSNGRGMSIRTLFEQIPNVLRKLTPCMLMSPISVAQYLSAENGQYDIVIFDEASQLPTCKAVGVLARGKNAVIVGDPNQMPPTSFFAGNTIDEDNLDIEDLDSILDDCLALGMPSTRLQWHYRSRHESLIAFSNNEFYENSMFTFPSINDREKHVKLIKVDGFFNRKKGRINEAEASAIVKEIKRRYKDPQLRKLSIGVVTFNISQQTLIEDLLQEEFVKDVEFDRWANREEEALFVKNLENVQGDERDVILFSIAFGPDEEGKLSLNFGPLNKDGGWKRLNVAVSRARNEMIVYSIMTADMIELKRTKSKGVEALKNFLAFAQKGTVQNIQIENYESKYHGMMDEICMLLKNNGYKYQKNVGHSKFKIDIAIINPYNEEEYLLGIMMDGETYHQSQNTKDREVSQISVLKNLGWKIHRIWTMDWWDNKQKEQEKILEILDKEKQEAYKKEIEFNSEKNKFEETEEVLQTEESNKIKENEINFGQESKETGKIKTENKIKEKDNMKIDISLIEPRKAEDIEMIAGNYQKANIAETEKQILKYSLEEYREAILEPINMTTSDYVLKENADIIVKKLQQIIDEEAPIAQEKLIKKCLRSFGIGRSSAATIEATEKALKKTDSKSNRQNGIKFYWKAEQNPDEYSVYRKDINNSERRLPEEICQQELKNAVCYTLEMNKVLYAEELTKETIRNMGFSRSGSALMEAVTRGLKYGLKTGELIKNEDKTIQLNQDI